MSLILVLAAGRWFGCRARHVTNTPYLIKMTNISNYIRRGMPCYSDSAGYFVIWALILSSFVFVGVMEGIVGSSLFHACRPQVLNFGRLIPIWPFYTGFVVVSRQILAFSVFLLQVVVGPLPAAYACPDFLDLSRFLRNLLWSAVLCWFIVFGFQKQKKMLLYPSIATISIHIQQKKKNDRQTNHQLWLPNYSLQVSRNFR